MLSKAQIKHIRSLSLQKFRKENRKFLVEGDKIVKEWLSSRAIIEIIIGVEEWMNENEKLLLLHPTAKQFIVTKEELKTLSSLQTPNCALAIVGLNDNEAGLPFDKWAITLAQIQDPGNMGTIIRIADWFGIEHIVCSPDCVDVYNPKVIQAAMGSHLRVQFHTANLLEYLSNVTIPIIAATLHGDNISQLQPFDNAVLLIGNESKGLNEQLIQIASHKITIPRKGSAESLNAAVATGIICAQLIR